MPESIDELGLSDHPAVLAIANVIIHGALLQAQAQSM